MHPHIMTLMHTLQCLLKERMPCMTHGDYVTLESSEKLRLSCKGSKHLMSHSIQHVIIHPFGCMDYNYLHTQTVCTRIFSVPLKCLGVKLALAHVALTVRSQDKAEQLLHP